MVLLSCKELTVCYGQTEAVKHISFEINEGDYICIVGKNGTGKSTLIKALLALVPIKSGIIEKNLQGIGYLPQQTDIQKDFPTSVTEVVLSGTLADRKRRISPFYSKADKANAKNQLEKLSLTDIQHKSFRDLSGGQQQRVLLARSLCAAKKLLVLDEPSSGLDPVIANKFYAILEHLNKEENLAILMVSHDIKQAVKKASSILHLDKKALFYGAASEYKKTLFFRQLANENSVTLTEGE